MSAPAPARSPSRLLDYLPAIYRTDPFIGQFLLAFEAILLGRRDPDLALPTDAQTPLLPRGLEETIAELALYFDPLDPKIPAEFLTWLSGWVALSLRADLDPAVQSQFIANVAQRYRYRGTKDNLQELLRIFIQGTPTITEPSTAEFQIRVHSTLAEDTYLRGGPPHFFQVQISLPRMESTELARQLEIARSIIELEKPAHTTYELQADFPSLQIGVVSTVGIDTLLGTIPDT